MLLTGPALTLVVDIGEGGHQHRQLKLLLDQLFQSHHELLDKLWFYISPVVARETQLVLNDEVAHIFHERLIPAQPGSPNSALRGVSEAANRVGAAHIIFLEIDPFIYILARTRLRQTVSGVWFRPSYHYSRSGLAPEGTAQRLVSILKNIVARVLCARRHVHRLLVFDQWAADHASRYFRTDKIRYVPVPFGFESMATEGSRLPLHERRLIFSIVGEISKRKGILPVLDALTLLSAGEQRRTQLNIVGRVRNGQRDCILGAIANARHSTSVEILQVDDFVSDQALDETIEHSDAILILYQRFIGSSGVLIRAALHKRPVLATTFGWIGATVRRHQLGPTMNPRDPKAIASAMTASLNGEYMNFSVESATRFASGHRPERYAEEVARLLRESARRPTNSEPGVVAAAGD
jgi:glycosyltransferase involved in cell wall biosynthesis